MVADNLCSLRRFCYGRVNAGTCVDPLDLLRNLAMSFKDLMESWGKQQIFQTTRRSYSVNLPLNDASRLHALAELYPAMDIKRLITDLVSTALDEIVAAMPYVPGERVIREDDYGDPVYEDVGMTPRFLELVRKNQQSIQTSDV